MPEIRSSYVHGAILALKFGRHEVGQLYSDTHEAFGQEVETSVLASLIRMMTFFSCLDGRTGLVPFMMNQDEYRKAQGRGPPLRDRFATYVRRGFPFSELCGLYLALSGSIAVVRNFAISALPSHCHPDNDHSDLRHLSICLLKPLPGHSDSARVLGHKTGRREDNVCHAANSSIYSFMTCWLRRDASVMLR